MVEYKVTFKRFGVNDSKQSSTKQHDTWDLKDLLFYKRDNLKGLVSLKAIEENSMIFVFLSYRSLKIKF